MGINRRIYSTALAFGGFAAPLVGRAQQIAFPSKPIRIVCPFAPGCNVSRRTS